MSGRRAKQIRYFAAISGLNPRQLRKLYLSYPKVHQAAMREQMGTKEKKQQ